VAIPLTVRCECGEAHSVRLGDEVDCACGRHYDTSSLPPAQFGNAQARQARIRLYLQLGFIFVAGVSLVTALVWGLKGIALGLPLSALVWFLFLGKWYRKRWLLEKSDAPALQLEATER
jgi:hypothetical protein